jgi:RNA polymerase sigma factor for flagellar operon FliA
VAAELGISEKDLQDILRQISFVGVAALDEVFSVSGERGDRATLGDTIPDSTEGPGALFEDKESKEILAQAIKQLGERERTVLSLYYYEGLTLAEIGDILGVTESRVCQIHTKAVLQLRGRLTEKGSEGGEGRGTAGGGRSGGRRGPRSRIGATG